MLLRNKENGCIYDVTSEYSNNKIAIYARLLKAKSDVKAESYWWDYDSIKELSDTWEDVD